jgi:hypothetical protein
VSPIIMSLLSVHSSPTVQNKTTRAINSPVAAALVPPV